MIKKLGLKIALYSNTKVTYTSCQMSSEDIVNTHDTFIKSLAIELFDDDKKLPYLYWARKLHKCPLKDRSVAGSGKCTTRVVQLVNQNTYGPLKHRFVACSGKCTTKELSSLLTKIFTVIKTGLDWKKCCSIKTSHTGVDIMWILKNSTNLLSSLSDSRICRATFHSNI